MDDAPAAAAPVHPSPLGPLLRGRASVLATVAAGGALGSLGRWGLSQTLLARGVGHGFPWPTFTANVLGCLLLGALTVVLAERRPTSRLLRLFLGVGVLGGFTTFSTLMLETRGLWVVGRPGLALGYVGASLVAGLAAVVAGMRLLRTTGPA